MNEKIKGQIRENIEQIIALLLWEFGAIKINVEKPFKLVSGNYSPIYINCRLLISHTQFMDLFCSFAHWLIKSEDIRVDLIAGGETAGIPFSAYLAQRLGYPMAYVRKRSKEHGISSLVEGDVKKDHRVLLVEDLITDGLSKKIFIDGLRDQGAVVKDCLVIFDREQGGFDFLREMGVTLYVLCNMRSALSVGGSFDMISSADGKDVQVYLEDPKKWQEQRGFQFIG
jgi:orotate phosphoribosyltransferase